MSQHILQTNSLKQINCIACVIVRWHIRSCVFKVRMNRYAPKPFRGCSEGSCNVPGDWKDHGVVVIDFILDHNIILGYIPLYF